MALGSHPTLLEVNAELGVTAAPYLSLNDCITQSGESFDSLMDFAGWSAGPSPAIEFDVLRADGTNPPADGATVSSLAHVGSHASPGALTYATSGGGAVQPTYSAANKRLTYITNASYQSTFSPAVSLPNAVYFVVFAPNGNTLTDDSRIFYPSTASTGGVFILSLNAANNIIIEAGTQTQTYGPALSGTNNAMAIVVENNVVTRMKRFDDSWLNFGATIETDLTRINAHFAPSSVRSTSDFSYLAVYDSVLSDTDIETTLSDLNTRFN